MTPKNLETPSAIRQRRVRRMAGLLAGGAVAATAVVGLPAFAQSHDDGAQAGTTAPMIEATTTTTSTSTTPPLVEATLASAVPSEHDRLVAAFASMTPEQQLAFKLYTASPEERAAFVAYVSPPPPPPKPAPKPASTVVTPPRATGGGAPSNGFLACVRNRESRGNYTVSNGAGYYGAYQFSTSTWNNTAQHAGRGDLVGVNPAAASPADQDALAASLYAWQGRSPWAGPGC